MTILRSRVLAVKSEHLHALKDTLSVILEDAKPTHRLEILARMCGYRTWASMKPKLDDAIDRPLVLEMGLLQPDAFMLEQPVAVRRRIARIGFYQITALIEAGLNLCYDRFFGHIGLGDDIDIEDIVQHRKALDDEGRGTPFSVCQSLYRSVVVSPQNQLEIINAARYIKGLDKVNGDNLRWVGATVEPHPIDPMYHPIQDKDIVWGRRSSTDELSDLLRKRSMFLTQDDIDDFRSVMTCDFSRENIHDPIVVEDIYELSTQKSALKDIVASMISKGDIKIPDDAEAIDEQYAMKCISVIATTCLGYNAEYERIMFQSS